MRNRLIHAYFDIDVDILWVTATVEVPDLLKPLRVLLDETIDDGVPKPPPARHPSHPDCKN